MRSSAKPRTGSTFPWTTCWRRARAPAARPDAPTQASPGELSLRWEREFLIRCLSSADLGHDFLGKPDDEQFSSELTRRARAHFVSEFDDPVATVPQDDPRLAALVTDLAFAAQERPPTDERTLEFSLLQLELRRIQREIRRAVQDGELGRQRSWPRQSSPCARRWVQFR